MRHSTTRTNKWPDLKWLLKAPFFPYTFRPYPQMVPVTGSRSNLRIWSSQHRPGPSRSFRIQAHTYIGILRFRSCGGRTSSVERWTQERHARSAVGPTSGYVHHIIGMQSGASSSSHRRSPKLVCRTTKLTWQAVSFCFWVSIRASILV